MMTTRHPAPFQTPQAARKKHETMKKHEAMYAEAQAAFERRDFQAAMRLLGVLLKADPGNVSANVMMAQIALGYHATRTALDHARTALLRGSGHPVVHYVAADAFLAHRHPDEALRHVEIAENKLRGNSNVELLKAKILQQLGKHAEAAAIARGILQRDPVNAAANIFFSSSHKFLGDEPEIKAMEAAFLKTSPSSTHFEPRRSLAYSLGKAYDDTKRHDRAFEFFAAAAATFDSDRNADHALGRIAAMRKHFTRAFIDEKSRLGHPSKAPIFVVGMPRSGTTLTEQILSCHPQVAGVGELLAMNRIADKIGIENSEGQAAATLPVAEFNVKNLRQLAEAYLNTVKSFGIERPHYVDKMPQNFIKLGLIKILFPNAKIIHTFRDPIDNCVSCFTNAMNEQHPYAKDLEGLGKYYREYWSLMNYWREECGIEFFDMPYEATVADLEGRARALIDYVGLPWDDACLRFNEAKTTVATLSVWQVRQPIYTTSVKRWKAYEKHLGPLIEALGDLAVTD